MIPEENTTNSDATFSMVGDSKLSMGDFDNEYKQKINKEDALESNNAHRVESE